MGIRPGNARRVPVLRLQADEHAQHHDHQLDEHAGPVLAFHVADEPSQDHRIGSFWNEAPGS